MIIKTATVVIVIIENNNSINKYIYNNYNDYNYWVCSECKTNILFHKCYKFVKLMPKWSPGCHLNTLFNFYLTINTSIL